MCLSNKRGIGFRVESTYGMLLKISKVIVHREWMKGGGVKEGGGGEGPSSVRKEN